MFITFRFLDRLESVISNCALKMVLNMVEVYEFSAVSKILPVEIEVEVSKIGNRNCGPQNSTTVNKNPLKKYDFFNL